MASTTSLEPVVAELDFQLTQWYESLPDAAPLSFTRTTLPDPVQTVLRLRFFACKTIIYRPTFWLCSTTSRRYWTRSGGELPQVPGSLHSAAGAYSAR